MEKILCIIPLKFDHVATTIIESHYTYTISVADLKGSIENHINKILKKPEKVSKELLKNKVNFNNSAKRIR